MVARVAYAAMLYGIAIAWIIGGACLLMVGQYLMFMHGCKFYATVDHGTAAFVMFILGAVYLGAMVSISSFARWLLKDAREVWRSGDWN